MTHDEARLLLLMHGSGTLDAEGQPLIAEDGFLGSLRPYRGLTERNFHLVMEALFTVGETPHRSPQFDRELVHSLWSMCFLARHWGLHPQGMLQRNKLILPADTERLERWIHIIESTALSLLGGGSPHVVVYGDYGRYVADVGWGDNIDFFIPLMERAISDPDLGEGHLAAPALGKLGRRAKRSLPILQAALTREYTLAAPHDRWTEHVRGILRQAIQSIEADVRDHP